MKDWLASKLGAYTSKKLHVPHMETFLDIDVILHGKVIDHRHQRSKSWVRNAYNMAICQVGAFPFKDSTFGAGLMSLKATSGTVRYSQSYLNRGIKARYFDVNNGFNAAVTIDEFGIIIGSSTQAESFEDYNLISQIYEGTGVGQATHTASEPVNVYYSGGVFYAEWARFINNNSTSVLYVNEVGLVARLWYYKQITTYYYDYFLYSRDKLSSQINFPDAGQLKITYTIALTYP